ncbi:MAG: J domain-containing protein [Bdellovibrio sp.]
MNIRDGQQQFPPRNEFGLDYIHKSFYFQDTSGDRIKIEIYPEASPSTDVDSQNRAPNQTFLPERDPRRPQESFTQPSRFEEIEALKLSVIDRFDQKLSPSSLELVVDAIYRSPALMKSALENRVATKNKKIVELANFGINRYFWFIPEGKSEYVAARILDIHRKLNPETFVLLAEYIKDVDHPTGTRTRQIFQIRNSEFKSITEVRPIDGKNRSDAVEEFYGSLTPEETQIIKLAKSLRLKHFGYFNYKRGPGEDGSTSPTPLEAMNQISHLAIRLNIQKTFGNIDDLMTPEELSNDLSNIIDVFSRIKPRYLIKRFGEKKGLDTRFHWVITEDGVLKAIPGQSHLGNLNSTLLRLAGGRKIFAGGDLFLNTDGSLNVRMKGYNYQGADASWGDSAVYQADNPNINRFVSIVFGIQMGKIIRNLQAQEVETWHHRDELAELLHGNEEAKNRQHRQNTPRFKFQDDFVASMERRALNSAESDTKGKIEAWDLEKGKPLSLSEYAKQLGRSAENADVRSEWAHYVLQTNPQMTWGNIKNQYRKLAMRFHPDRLSARHLHADAPSERRMSELMQDISLANKILKNELNESL